MPAPHLQEIYTRLFNAFGPQQWWPGDTPWEIACGAVLTQNTNWKNVEKSIIQLKAVAALEAAAVHALPPDDLADLIRPAGYFNIKAKRLKNLAAWWLENNAPDGCVDTPLHTLRNELLSINGIGPETADCILLYAFGRTIFVSDAYTKRFLTRHNMVAENATYHDIQELFQTQLGADKHLFNEYHALIVTLGKEHCKPTPICDGCPLESLL